MKEWNLQNDGYMLFGFVSDVRQLKSKIDEVVDRPQSRFHLSIPITNGFRAIHEPLFVTEDIFQLVNVLQNVCCLYPEERAWQ